MTDEPKFPALSIVTQLLNPEAMEAMDRSCELALKKQLNKNELDPRLKALADKWKTMDAFSKRELGAKQNAVKK